MKSLVLIGFMGTGKSTLGKVLASRLKLPLLDLDNLIVQEQQMQISDIFACYGEERFRQIEHEILCRYAVRSDCIISPGGGAVLRSENRAVMKEYCFVISLVARPEVILQRVNGDTTIRPVLEQREQGQSKLQRIEQVLAQRMPYYQEANLQLDTSDYSVEMLADQVITWIAKQVGDVS